MDYTSSIIVGVVIGVLAPFIIGGIVYSLCNLWSILTGSNTYVDGRQLTKWQARKKRKEDQQWNDWKNKMDLIEEIIDEDPNQLDWAIWEIKHGETIDNLRKRYQDKENSKQDIWKD